MDFFNDVGNFIEDYTPIGVIEKSLRGVKRETKKLLNYIKMLK